MLVVSAFFDWAFLLVTHVLDGDARQLLRSLRQRASTARFRRTIKGSNNSNNDNGSRSGARTSQSGLQARRGVIPPARTGAKFGSPPFSPPDAWDDTGLFTVAPRPKTVPSTGATKRNRNPHQKPTIESHTLADPVFARPSATPQVPLLPPSTGSLGGTAVVGTIPPGDLWHKGDDFRGGAASDGFGLWPKRRRKVRVPVHFCYCCCWCSTYSYLHPTFHQSRPALTLPQPMF